MFDHRIADVAQAADGDDAAIGGLARRFRRKRQPGSYGHLAGCGQLQFLAGGLAVDGEGERMRIPSLT